MPPPLRLGNDTLPRSWVGNATLPSQRIASRPTIWSRPTGPAVRPTVWSFRNGTALTHVVSTRFSLGQGNQAALVEARLQLLFSLCVPSMVQQLRDARFVWLIYHDSTLALEHVAAVAARLQPLASSGFRLVRERVDGQFGRSAQEQLQLAGLWTPPPPGAKVLYVASRLDADDGLPRGAILELQDRARAALPSCGRAPPTSAHVVAAHVKPEFVSCYASAYEWAPSARARAGSLSLSVGGGCLSVALSVASCRSSLAATALAGAHHTLLSSWAGRRECKRRSSPGKDGFQPGLVLRARTVTSNGMSNVRPAATVGASPLSPAQRAFLSSTYAISTVLLERANRWLVDHERQVAASQLEGRCKPGFSCKSAAASGLQVLAKGRRMRDDPHGGCDLWQMGP